MFLVDKAAMHQKISVLSMLIWCSLLLKFPQRVDQAIRGLVKNWINQLGMQLEEDKKTQHRIQWIMENEAWRSS
ncbi:hypothetical protein PIB30_051218 [Stylosanthes scabra]|uniref:Uncharacterized protein n=1 Tax=Stylosanthes scabra TaxID=79078 RepID=A0ABU6SIF5_9FABA|nr:hypothetical protein [Stylosanthes scabra]